MLGLSAIVTFQNIIPEGQLEEMLKWNIPPFSLQSTNKPPTYHKFKNASVGTIYPDSLISDSAGKVWLASSSASSQEILTQYLVSGVESFKSLSAECSFILIDERSQELFAVRDRLGIHPLYWHVNNKSAYLSTSLKSILSTGAISPTPDLSAIASSLGLGYISQDASCIEGVNRLLPGYFLKLSFSGAYSIEPYWSYSSTFARHYSTLFDSSIDIYCELERKVKAAICKSESRRAGCLSGTIGSYIIWDTLQEHPNSECLLLKLKPTPEDFLSSLIPMVWAMEMPNAEMNALESWKQIQACKENDLTCYFDSGFSAEFYDYSKEAKELFQSHYHVRRDFEPSFWSKLGFSLAPKKHLNTLRLLQEATPQMAFLENQLLLSPDDFAEAAPELSHYFDPNLFIHQFYNLPDIPKLDASLFYLTIKTATTDGLSESRLRMAQSHGLQTQSPFLDHQLLEFFGSISPEIWASPDLIANFPNYWMQNREVSQDIASWPNASLFPEALFLSKEVWPWFCGLEKGTLVDMGLVSSAWIKKALQNPKKHLHALYALLILEIWMCLFIDRPLRESNKNLKLEEILNKA